MEGLFPLLFLILTIVLNVISANEKRKKKQRQQQQQANNKSRRRTDNQQKQQRAQTRDHMMAKPKQQQSENVYRQSYADKQPVQNQRKHESYANSTVESSLARQYREYAARKRTYTPNRDLDYIQLSEIKSDSKERKMQINIEKQQIMQAITYAQILEQPKSLQYLKRFGIKRVIHKD